MYSNNINTSEYQALEGSIANSLPIFKKGIAAASASFLLAARKAYQFGFNPQMEAFMASQEQERMEAYLSNMTRRLETDLNTLLLDGEHSTEEKLEEWEKTLQKEHSYVTAHIDAAEKRVERAQELAKVFKESPRGAIWKLGVAKVHTPDCLAMGGKAWSWPVLLSINPYNRHYGCKCSIVPIPDDFPVQDINTGLPATIELDSQEATTFQMAKKAFYIAKRGVKRSEYTAHAKLEASQRKAKQIAQLGGYFVNINGKPIFINMRNKGTRANISARPQNTTRRTSVSAPSTGPTRPAATPNAGKTASPGPVSVTDDAGITPDEANRILEGFDHDVFSVEGLKAMYNGRFRLGDGREVETRVYSWIDATNAEFAPSDNPSDVIANGVIKVDGKAVGTFRRRLYHDKDTDEWVADHEYLALEKVGDKDGRLVEGGQAYEWMDAEEIEQLKGQGIGSKFNRRAEVFYRTAGFDKIVLFANKDVGGYAWARAGYNFRSGSNAKQIWDDVFKSKGFARDMRKLTFDSKAQIMKNVPFGQRVNFDEQVLEAVTPYDVSQIGREGPHWEHEGHDMWYGKALLMGSGWDAEKPIRPYWEEELASMEAELDEISDFARELILASHGRSDLDEYMISRIRAEIHYLWTEKMEEGRKHTFSPGAFSAMGSKQNSYNLHHYDVGATPEDDEAYFAAVEQAISDFDLLLKASVFRKVK